MSFKDLSDIYRGFEGSRSTCRKNFKNLILIGFPGSGKSTIGGRLAKSLSYPFVDTDYLVEEYFSQQVGEKFTCRQIMQQVGEDAFRQLERVAIVNLDSSQPTVIATGGGSILSDEIVHILKNIGILFFVDRSQESLFEHAMKKGTPFCYQESDLKNSFEKMFNDRYPLYLNICDEKVLINDSIDESVTRILSLWQAMRLANISK